MELEIEQTNDDNKFGYSGKIKMIDLGKHDSLIKEFLNDRTVLETISDSVKHESSEILLRYVISKKWSKSEPMQYKHISKATDLEISAIADTLKSDLNESLGFISGKYNIVPPIQLYFRTKRHNVEDVEVAGNSNIGAHFACSVNTNKHISGTFIVEHKLKEMLSEALEEIKRKQSTRPPKLKYLKDVRDVLKFNGSDESKWFRKTGPIAIDFAEEKVCPRLEALGQIREHIFNNSISILEGNAGTGKSVLVRQFAYDLIAKENKSQIFHYSFKLNLPISDFREFKDEINSVSGLVIIEDIHLATPHMQCVVDELIKKSSGHILLTTRPSFRSNMLEQRPDTLKKLPILSLGQQDDTDKIIEHYIQKHFDNHFQWTQEIKKSIKKVSKDNLWLLSYALRGCDGNSEPLSWIGKEVSNDLEYLEKLKCKPQILVALSALYMNESMMAHSYLAENLGFANNDINRLVELGEIIKCRVGGDIFYGLPHSSLALAYWEHGSSYRNMLKFSECEDFVYNYAISGVSNGLSAILNTDDTKRFVAIGSLAISNKLLEVVEKEENCDCYITLAIVITGSNLCFIISRSILFSLASLSVKRKAFWALFLLCALGKRFVKKLWHSIDKEKFVNGLYDEEDFDIICTCLGEISSASNKCRNEIYEMIDFEKLISRLREEQVVEYLKSLSEIDENIMMRFWKQSETLKKLLNFKPSCYFDTTDSLIILTKIFSGKRVDASTVSESLKQIYYKKLISMVENSGKLKELINALYLHKGMDIDHSESCILELWNQADYNKLLLKMNELVDQKQAIQILEKLSEVNENITLEYWSELNKNDLAMSIQLQQAREITLCISTIFKANKKIGQGFWEKHLDIPRIAAKFCNAEYFWDIFCLAQSLKDKYSEGAREFCDEFIDSASMLEKLLKQKKDSFAIIGFVATLCQVGSKTGEKLHHLIGENIESYTKIFIQEKHMWNFFDDVIADVDLIAAEKLYMYYCENIGIEKYIEKVQESNSKEIVNRCFVFLSKVDPNNKGDWKRQIDRKSIMVRQREKYLKLLSPVGITLKRCKWTIRRFLFDMHRNA